MFNKMFNSVGDFFSLDIGSTSVRGVQLKGSKNTLVRYHRAPIDGSIVKSDSASDITKLTDSIKEFVKAGKFTGKDVVAGIASNDLFITVVDIPKVAEKELKRSIKYQIEQHIPIPLDEAKVDWRVLGESPEGPDKLELLIASVSNTYVEARLDLLEQAGLNVLAFEPDGLALARALVDKQAEGAHMVLDIGWAYTDLVIVHSQMPKLIRSIPTGGQSLIKAVMNSLGVDEKQAEQFVYKFGLNETKLEGQVKKALEPAVNNIIEEIKKSIAFFSNRYKGVNVERIIVTGGASTTPELPLHVANQTGIQVEIGNAWLNTGYPDSKHNDLMAVSGGFAVAAGLAERKEE